MVIKYTITSNFPLKCQDFLCDFIRINAKTTTESDKVYIIRSWPITDGQEEIERSGYDLFNVYFFGTKGLSKVNRV
jgi:hypothetical protein